MSPAGSIPAKLHTYTRLQHFKSGSSGLDISTYNNNIIDNNGDYEYDDNVENDNDNGNDTRTYSPEGP